MLAKGKNTAPARPLSGVDYLVDSWTDYIFVYDEVLCAETLFKGLEKALTLNPYFGGRKFRGNDNQTYITGACEGALFEHIESDSLLPESVCEHDTYKRQFLCDDSKRPKHKRSKTSLKTPLFQVKLSNFKNGSVLGLSIWHPLSDGATFLAFLDRWRLLTQGKDATPLDTSLYSAEPPAVATAPVNFVDISGFKAHELAFPECKEKTFVIDAQAIANLPRTACADHYLESDYIAALIWSLISKASGLKETELRLYSIYDIRELLELTSNAMGNHLYYPSLSLSTEELCSLPLEEIAAKIRESAFQLIDDLDSIKNDIGWANSNINGTNAKQFALKPLFDTIFSSATAFNNLSGVPFYDVSFADRQPIFVDNIFDDPARFITYMPSAPGRDEIILKINLPAEQMDTFTVLFDELFSVKESIAYV